MDGALVRAGACDGTWDGLDGGARVAIRDEESRQWLSMNATARARVCTCHWAYSRSRRGPSRSRRGPSPIDLAAPA